jgi:uncharacterized protein YbjT (DUF2867 family)
MNKIANQQMVVTGAFGYTGKYITRRLLAIGARVRTLTAHPNRPNEFGAQVEVAPLNFENRAALVASLRGADCLFNTYWVRFNHNRSTFDQAVANTKILIDAAKEAGVRKIIHLSITNPSLDSELPYFKGKAELEKAIRRSGLRYAILRPTVIFGPEDILINNIAWFLRHFPLFAVPGAGDYRLQPIFVEDVADLAVRAAQEAADTIRDAVGPEILTFHELVERIAAQIKSRAHLIHLPPSIALLLSSALGVILRDQVLTREEIKGLMAGLLVSANRPTGKTRFSEWLARNAEALGRRYSSELARHYQTKSPEGLGFVPVARKEAL